MGIEINLPSGSTAARYMHPPNHIIEINRSYLGASSAILILLTVLSSCTSKQSVKDFISADKNCFIDKKFIGEDPIAEIINPAAFSESSIPFELKDSSDVHVFGSGELLYNFANVSQEYFFLSDDIELFFKGTKETQIPKEFIFSWGDLKGRGGKYSAILPEGVVMNGFMQEDSLKRKKYFVEISVPFKSLGLIDAKEGDSIPFDIAIGDTDEHFVQEGKIAWSNNKEPLRNSSRTYGTVVLRKKDISGPEAPDAITSIFGRATLDWNTEDPSWKSAPRAIIKNVVAGSVKDKYDLSAKFQSCWSKDSLYLLVDISDGNQDRIFMKKLKDEQTFLDYGWIEDEKGVKIWEMHALNSRHAGGANKNHLVDTILQLKQGKYTLKFSSDESHSYGNWDAEPPTVPFYGIAVFSQKK